jgi:hypothetical protein
MSGHHRPHWPWFWDVEIMDNFTPGGDGMAIGS